VFILVLARSSPGVAEAGTFWTQSIDPDKFAWHCCSWRLVSRCSSRHQGLTEPAAKWRETLALTYLLNPMGELCLSPIGLSMVSKLAARRIRGSRWVRVLCPAIATTPLASSRPSRRAVARDRSRAYAAIYTQIAVGGFVLGGVFVLSAPDQRLMHGVK
jgi:dipeptide/tripeptide permease